LPDDRRPPFGHLDRPGNLQQRGEWQVNQANLIGQVRRVEGVVGRPGDGARAEDVEREANRKPQRHAVRSPREARPIERWFHASQSELPGGRITSRRAECKLLK